MIFRLFNRYWSKVAAASLFAESVVVLMSAWIGYQVRFRQPESYFLEDGTFWYRSSVLVLVVMVSLYLNGLYEFSSRPNKLYVGVRLVRSLTFAALALWGIYYVIPALFLGRGVLAITFCVAGVLLSGWRLILIRLVADSVFSHRILIIGTDSSARRLAQETLKNEHIGYQVAGFLSDDPEMIGRSIVNPRVLGPIDRALELSQRLGISEVVVAQRDSRGKLDLDSLLECKTQGIRVARGADFLERLAGKLDLDEPRIRSWLLFSDGFVSSRSILFVKRAIDLSVSLVLLLLSAPILLITAIAIPIDSRGPVLYRQLRVGKGKRPFTVLKFRSMREDSESDGVAKWASASDPRVTRVGRLIRNSRIDELPQLINVLKGQMSLVGPRPERPEFVEHLSKLSPFYDFRLSVRPGLTGWAQIKAPYAATLEESIDKLRYDLFYIKHLSAFLDLSILASTIRIVLIGRGAR